MTRPPLYGIDLVTDTTAGGTSGGPPPPPTSGPRGDERIVAVGLSLDGRDRCFDGDEADLLAELDEFLGELPPGVLVTWHGANVDLPVLAARSASLGVAMGLRVRRDVRPVEPATDPAGSAGEAWCGAWHQHRHLDLARVYCEPPPRGRWPWRSPAVPEDLMPPSDERTGHDPRHDAHLARCLAERRWARARRLVDRMPPAPGAGPRLPHAPAAIRSA